MSDPPKKPSSLRDRIAAFEKGGGSSPAPAPAPPLRPKPAGGAQWKPRPRTPPSADPSPAASPADNSHGATKVGGMSATDAKEAIGRGSLKERMAALQGVGAFGGASPPPRPATEKPKWKPPPVVASPSPHDDDEHDAVKDTEEPGSEARSTSADDEHGADVEEGQAEADVQEEERQRRAAIAARLARLGGTKIGMAPPMIGKKPEIKKPEIRKDEEGERAEPAGLTSPSAAGTESPHGPDTEDSPDYFAGRNASSSSLLSPESGSSTSVRSPAMPVPTGPRRVAPPRKRPAKSPSPAPPAHDEVAAQSPSSVSTKVSDVIAMEPHAELAEATAQPSQYEEHIKTSGAQSLEAAISHLSISEPPVAVPHDVVVADVPPLDGATLVHHVDKPDIPADDDETQEPIPVTPPTDEIVGPAVDAAEEDEEDETARRKRIAERLAKSGGFNPLSGLPPPTSPPAAGLERRQSQRDSEIISPRSPVAEISAARRLSSDSIGACIQATGTAEPPALPSSPKPESLGRKSSVGSVQSSSGVEPPTRRLSQDDQRTVLSGRALLGQSHAASAPEAFERSSEEVGSMPHAAHEGHDLQSVREDEERYRYQPGEDTSISDNFSAHSGGYEYDDQSAYSDHEVEPEKEEELQVSAPPPPPPFATRPVQVPSHDVPVPLPPAVPTAARPPVKRQSIPPPPRIPPPPPRDEDDMDELRAVFSPPVRKASLPPVLPQPIARRSLDVDEDQQSVNPPLQSLQEERELTSTTVEVDEEQEYNGPPYEGDRGEAAGVDEMQLDEVAEDQEDTSPPPPPPPRPFSTQVPQPPQLVRNVAEEAPPPSPPERKQCRPVSHVPPLPVLTSRPRAETEVLDDSDGDPIDPAFHSPQRSASVTSSQAPPFVRAAARASASPSVSPVEKSTEVETISTPAPAESPAVPATEEEVGMDAEQARRRTIAERLAKLGGLRFGGPPPPMRPAQPPPPPPGDEDGTETPVPRNADPSFAEETHEEHEAPEPEEEEDEFARRQRIAARIANMGGMRFGMLPSAVAPPVARTRQPEPAEESAGQPLPPPPSRPLAVPPRPPIPIAKPPEQELDELESSEGEKVEPELSEAEEVSYEDAAEVAPPPVPSRGARRSTFEPAAAPPVPQGSRPPVPAVPVVSPRSSKAAPPSVPSFSYPPPPPPSSVRPPVAQYDSPGDYVLVDEPEAEELPPPPPPPRTASLKNPPPRAAPVPPPPPPVLEAPVIPIDFGGETDLSLSGQWSEDSTTYPTPPPARSGEQRGSTQASNDAHLSADDLMAQWGRVGVQIIEAATLLFDKSKKALIGDGSYLGFVAETLAQVPNAAQPAPPFESFGYLIYAQSGAAVQRRASDIMPGDVITLHDAKFKGHKGLQMYHQHAGADEPVLAIVSDFEAKKVKVKAFQANQHVGQQSVETVSYRLEDLKSGSVKIFRVLEA